MTHDPRVATQATELAATVSPTLEDGPDGAGPDSLGNADSETFHRRYRTGDSLGRGGMGEVRALDDRRVGRTVAMKTLHDQSDSAGARMRFVREARIQGQLEHPSVLPVYDFGLDPQDRPYFTMKQLRGHTLSQILASLAAGDADTIDRYSLRKLLSELRDVCLAIEFAHSRNVIHRDLKPGNIMLGDFGEVYVLDWGLAKLTTEPVEVAVADPHAPSPRDTDSDAPTLSASTPRTPSINVDSNQQTVAGALLGTPGYMSPEQVRGETLDRRSDVYALGAILFEILSGQPLHPRDGNMLESTLDGVDGRPSSRCDREIPPELDELCVDATRTDRSERIATARELADRIDRYLDGDRDLERRRELAEEHATRGAEAARTALAHGDGAEGARQAALHELGQAMILDPANESAIETISELLLAPPKSDPPEVVHALTESVAKRSREEARLTAFAYLMPFLFLPLFWWMGIRDFAPIAVLIGASGATALGLHVYARAHELHRWVLYASVVLTGILLVAGARAFSPFLVVPAIGAVASVPVTYHGDRRLLVVTAIVLSISVTLPAVLEQLGLLSSTFASTADGLELRSAALDIRGTATTIALVGFNIMIVTLPMMLTARLTARTDSYERQIALHSWQLRQLVPRAKDLARARAPEPRSWCA